MKINNRMLTVNAFYAVGGGMILFLAYAIWKSFLLGWAPIIIDFNFYKEGVLELLIVTWTAMWLIIYVNWRIRKDYEGA